MVPDAVFRAEVRYSFKSQCALLNKNRSFLEG